MEPFFRVQISDERAANVINEISVGSEPELRFYAMVAASTAIATFGLISNSTAVVIGAMLVAPLMTPIFGIALALIRGDATLLGRAVRAEIVGVFLTVALAACFGFLIVAAFLSRGLYEMIQARQLKGSIEATLTEELSHLSATELQKVVHQKNKGKLFVLAHVHASGDITPSRVKLMEKALESQLKVPVELFVRSTLSEDISSTGSINQVLTETLDGFFVGLKSDPRIDLMKAAEQTIREYMDTQPALYVEEVNLIPISGKPLILATIFGMIKMSPKEIQDLEVKIRQRTGDNTIDLAIRHSDVELQDRFGKAYYEWSTLQGLTPEQKIIFNNIEGLLRMEFDNSEYSLTNNDFSIRDGIYYVLVELTGPKLYSHEELAELRKKIAKITGDQLQVYVRSKPEVVLTQSGFTSFDKLQDKFLKEMGSTYKKEIDEIIKEAL